MVLEGAAHGHRFPPQGKGTAATTRFRLTQPGPAWWPGLALPLLPFAYACAFLFPRGDDFDEATRAMFFLDLPGGLYEVAREWLTWSGRYTYHFLAVFLGRAGASPPLYGLVCAGIISLFGVGLAGLARTAGAARREAAVCGVLGVAAVLCGHQCLPNLFMLTDALTVGLAQALTLVFLWRLCRLWAATPGESLACRRWAIAAGVCATGIFEHAALAVLTAAAVANVLALRAARASAEARARLRHLRIALLCLLGAALASFLAPGNQVRRAARHVSADVQWRQLLEAPAEWLSCAFHICDGPWLVTVPAVVLLLRGLRRRTGQPPARADGLWLAGLAVTAYLGVSVLMAGLHALSDVTLSAASKVPAGLTLFAAYALGFALWGLLDALPMPKWWARCLERPCPCACVLVPLLLALMASPNWRCCSANAANGGMALLGAQLEGRYAVLRALGTAARPADDKPRYGLAGEWYRPGVRRRALDPSLPMAVVPPPVPESVFPVHAAEALGAGLETWPNLWAAWMLGLGGVRQLAPLPERALALCGERGAAATPLAVPPPLRTAGMEAAWLVRASGLPPHASAELAPLYDWFWLVLRVTEGKSLERIAVLRVQAQGWPTLLPAALRGMLADKLLSRDRVPCPVTAGAPAHWAAWAGEYLQMPAARWRRGNGYCALPLSPACAPRPAGVFLGLQGGTLHRLIP